MVSNTMMQSSVIHYIYELMCDIIYIDQSFKRKSLSLDIFVFILFFVPGFLLLIF
jgi:TRAP-type mannitol/chloroaromatic compound transport system permease small subunit